MRHTPGAIDLAQTNRQPEKESAFVRGTFERGGAAPQDRDGEGDIFPSGDPKLLDVERLRRLVVREEEVARLLVAHGRKPDLETFLHE